MFEGLLEYISGVCFVAVFVLHNCKLMGWEEFYFMVSVSQMCYYFFSICVLFLINKYYYLVGS